MIGETRIEVRYAETDKMGVVYHANYLVWFEIARTKFLEELGFSYADMEQQGYMSPVTSAEVNYGAPLTYGETAVVRTRVTKLTSVKTQYSYEVYKQGQVIGQDKPCCTGSTMHCLVDAKTFKPVSQKRVFPELYSVYERVLEAE